MKVNLLTDDVIPFIDQGGNEKFGNIPDVLCALSQGNVIEIADVKEHQTSAVEFFFAHLGILGTDLAKDEHGISADADVWRERMLILAPLSSWDLINLDPRVPAFLQPGMSADDFAVALKRELVSCPDEMGALVKSKNHGIKFSAMANPSVWNWIVSLIEFQTMTGYEGAGNYGHQRMNGGYSYRFKAGIYEELTASCRWISDVQKVLDNLLELYRSYPHFDEFGTRKALAWDCFWDGATPLQNTEMHPLYIDCNRRPRLFVDKAGAIACAKMTSKGTRVLDLKLNGAYGDPWAPLRAMKETGEGAGTLRALFMQELTLENLCNVMFASSGFDMAMTQKPSKEQSRKDCFFEIKFLGKSQGKTHGFTNISVPVPTRAVAGLGNRDGRLALGASSSEMLKMARGAQRALSVGIDAFCVNGSGKSADKNHVAIGIKEKCIAALTKEIEASFFSHLWDFHDSKNAETWISTLRALCLKEFAFAVEAGQTRSQLAFKAEVFGRKAFEGYWHTVFPKNEKGVAA